jgi:hypothetical protein
MEVPSLPYRLGGDKSEEMLLFENAVFEAEKIWGGVNVVLFGYL